MNKKNEILSIYKSKIKILQKHNNLYYNNDKPIISDAEYDILKKEVLKLEHNYKFLKNSNLFRNTVGAPPTNKFNKIKHLKPMLSLSNAFNRNDIDDFIKKINNFLMRRLLLIIPRWGNKTNPEGILFLEINK